MTFSSRPARGILIIVFMLELISVYTTRTRTTNLISDFKSSTKDFNENIFFSPFNGLILENFGFNRENVNLKRVCAPLNINENSMAATPSGTTILSVLTIISVNICEDEVTVIPDLKLEPTEEQVVVTIFLSELYIVGAVILSTKTVARSESALVTSLLWNILPFFNSSSLFLGVAFSVFPLSEAILSSPHCLLFRS